MKSFAIVLRPMCAAVSLLVCLQASGEAVVDKVPCRLRVRSGERVRVDCPVVVPIKAELAAKELSLVELLAGGKRVAVPCQKTGDSPGVAWILKGTTQAGAGRVYALSLAGGGGSDKRSLTLAREDAFLAVRAGDVPVVRYNVQPYPAAAGTDTKKYPFVYGRTGYIHPVRTLSGKALTTVYPADHIHHVGLWHPWTGTEFEGRHVDFWNLKSGQGTVRFVKLLSHSDGPVFAEFSARQEHVDLKAPGGEKVALNDVLSVRVWGVSPEASVYVMDYVTTQSPASASPLKIGPYRYGGFGLRTTMEWKDNKCSYLTDDGKMDKASNKAPVRWCRLQGPCADGTAGILFMSHPANHEHPESTRTWGGIGKHGGFFNFNPAQKSAWVMEPGKSYTSRYRMAVYDGELGADTCERLWQDFGNPPTVDVLPAQE